MITDLIAVEQSWWNYLPLHIINESYLVNIKSETTQNDIHLEKICWKTFVSSVIQ